MDKKELAKLIQMAKEATEDVWGPIKRAKKPQEYPPPGYDEAEEWKRTDDDGEEKIILDSVAWKTYEMVLMNLIRLPAFQEVQEVQQKILEAIAKIINENEDVDDGEETACS